MLDEKNLWYSVNILKQSDDQTLCTCAQKSLTIILASFVDGVCVTDVSQVCMSGAVGAEIITWPLRQQSPLFCHLF